MKVRRRVASKKHVATDKSRAQRRLVGWTSYDYLRVDRAAASPSSWPDWLRANGLRFLLFARLQSRCEADAHDLLQDALLEAWCRGDGERPPDDSLVFTTIRRRAIDRSRGDDRRLRREQATLVDWFEPAPASLDPELDAELAQAVQALPDHLREVVAMKIWGGLTFQQIATTLGIPANTTASRYRYALAHLRATFKKVRP